MRNKFTEEEIEAARYLGRLKGLSLRMKSKRRKLEELEQIAYPGGISYDKIRVQTSPGNPQEDALIMVTEAVKDFDETAQEYHRTLIEIENVIKQVGKTDPEGESILRCRYVAMMRCAEIAAEMSYSDKAFFLHYHKAHSEAAEILHKSTV